MIVRKEMPEVGELVLVRIKKVMPFGAYCELVEYNNMDGYLPIKEVASGWIKNIHEFVKEGQRSVAKIVYIDKEKKAIDVSLKKVTKKEDRDKVNDYNLEKRAENLILQAAKGAGQADKKAEIVAELTKKYPSYNDVITAISEKKGALLGLKLSQKLIDELEDIVAKNIRPKVYNVSYVAEVTSYDTKKGVFTLKKAFEEIEKLGVTVTYLGAPRYRLQCEDSSYPKAEERIRQATAVLEQLVVPNGTLTTKKDKV
ncbi:MAG: S1 RNA-binding domain-containing protein [Candidatus Micrarchaeota archaeon]|nr:S1 RNA-binding domain-containing protein [Candidatus Micrarchaeota archaeon]MDE1847483.1 S1 RNA-binding domain-containing protein [Candidatus Micrarchaeota archaeon]MDE1864022.1 S1 RNA-binding domain-containing protein [Candidatus Micrarchaeota archaeon]